MNTETTQLEREIKAMGEQIKTKQHKLDTIRQMCDHTWDYPEGKYNPIVTKAYQDPGDPPGTMGG